MQGSTLRISFFGSPQLFCDDQPLPLPTPAKALSLWAHLLLNLNQPLSRELTAATLWPEVSDAEARANLRRHLHLLLKQLPAAQKDAPWIISTRKTLQWNPDSAFELDVARFDTFDPAGADDERWNSVLDLYRGDLLEGVYDDWALAERDQRHGRFAQLLEQRLAQQRTAGKLQAAAQTANRLLAHDPLLEEPYRQLMECYYRLGDRAAALQAFEKCQRVLQTELGVEPMAETLALRDRMVRGEQFAPLVSREASLAEPVPGQTTPAEPPAPIRTLGRRQWWFLAPVIVVLAAALWFSGVLSPEAAGEPVSAAIFGPAAVQDTWLNYATPDLLYDPEYQEDGSYADFPQVHLQYFNYPYDRMLIRFDLRTIPAGARIEQAIFRVRLEAFLNEDLPEPRPATVSAFQILIPWQVESASFNKPWSQPGMAAGVDYDQQAAGSQRIDETDWVSIDVTQLVSNWVLHPEENWGMLLMITEAPQGAHYWVDTSDHPLSNRQPRLEVSYTH